MKDKCHCGYCQYWGVPVPLAPQDLRGRRDALLGMSAALWKLDEDIDEQKRPMDDPSRAVALAELLMCDKRDLRREVPWAEVAGIVAPFDDVASKTMGNLPVIALEDPHTMPQTTRNILCWTHIREAQHIRRKQSVWTWFDAECAQTLNVMDDLLR